MGASLRGKMAAVTGGSEGIGLAAANRLAAGGPVQAGGPRSSL
jgi:NAD(P)-dependent dehydrogenase (short-subunit alcohol dehydrogenase family)